MTATLPAAEVAIQLGAYLRGRPILSGALAADIGWGWRGVIQETNLVYAWRTHVIAVMGAQDAESTGFYSTANTSYQVVTRTGRWWSGADVAEWELSADLEHGTLQLVTSRNTTTVVSAARSVQTADLSLSSATAGAVTWTLNFKATTPETGILYRVTLTERRLLAAQIP